MQSLRVLYPLEDMLLNYNPKSHACWYDWPERISKYEHNGTTYEVVEVDQNGNEITNS
jgi:hypothetical protein